MWEIRLAVAGLYEYLLTQRLDNLDVEFCCAQWPEEAAVEANVRALFRQPDLITVALQESRAKRVEASSLRGQLETLGRVWPGLKERLHQHLITLAELKTLLRAVGAPVELSFRVKYYDQIRDISDYFWKAVPAVEGAE